MEREELNDAVVNWMENHPSDEAHYLRYQKAYTAVMAENETELHEYMNQANSDTVVPHQLLRARASSVVDILRVCEAEPEFAVEAAGSFLNDLAEKLMPGGPDGFGSPDEKRQQAYNAALRTVAGKYPGVLAAYQRRGWTEAAVLECWPHLPKTFVNDGARKLSKSEAGYRQQLKKY